MKLSQNGKVYVNIFLLVSSVFIINKFITA